MSYETGVDVLPVFGGNNPYSLFLGKIMKPFKPQFSVFAKSE